VQCYDQLAHLLTFVLQRVQQCARNRVMRIAPGDQPVFDLPVRPEIVLDLVPNLPTF
jgi:hypothetical protein